jgi:SAM-dependent methyltransferase
LTPLNLRKRTAVLSKDSLSFTCNICAMSCRVPVSELHREEPSCPKCRSNVRFRGVIAALSIALYGQSLLLDDFPVHFETIGLGMSDWEGYAIRLRRVFGYDNTYYDEKTRLDIMATVPHALAATCDFIITSDVLEHVAPPYQVALDNLFTLLKPGGLIIVTVPLRPDGHTVEHFPDLFEYQIVSLGGVPVLVNRTASGQLQVFDGLVFHGGPGATLEMRMFSLPDLLDGLHRAGFEDVVPFDQAVPEHGVLWNEPVTCPIVARKPNR